MWTLDRRSHLPAWRWDPANEDAVLVFSTRCGGISTGPYQTLNLGRSTHDRPAAVLENRRRLLASLGLDPARLATAAQVHGARVIHVRQPGLHAGCDAMVTTVPGLALAVTAADCLPILFAVPGAVGVAHAGWRGTAAGAPEAALEALCRASGVSPAAVRIHLGPAIRPCCYAVDPEVAARFPAEALRRRGDRLHLDLPGAARLRLVAAGADPALIHDTGACTSCEPEWYFSHRRDRGLTGRHWALAALVAPPAPPAEQA